MKFSFCTTINETPCMLLTHSRLRRSWTRFARLYLSSFFSFSLSCLFHGWAATKSFRIAFQVITHGLLLSLSVSVFLINPFRLTGSLNHGLLNASLCVCTDDESLKEKSEDLPRRRSGVEVKDWQLSQNSRIYASHFLPSDYKKKLKTQTSGRNSLLEIKCKSNHFFSKFVTLSQGWRLWRRWKVVGVGVFVCV